MEHNQEIENNVLVPCLRNGEVLFNLKVQYITNGDKLVRINSSEFENPSQIAQFDIAELLNDTINTMVLMAVQSDHAYKQWQGVINENKKLMEAYQKSEANNKDITDKVSKLIEQGIITEEQFDNVLNDSKVK